MLYMDRRKEKAILKNAKGPCVERARRGKVDETVNKLCAKRGGKKSVLFGLGEVFSLPY